MADLFTIAILLMLLMLALPQSMFGSDDLPRIPLESWKAPQERQAYVRKLAITVPVLTDIVPGHYQRKILAKQARRQAGSDSRA